jgi:hypothetical protein
MDTSLLMADTCGRSSSAHINTVAVVGMPYQYPVSNISCIAADTANKLVLSSAFILSSLKLPIQKSLRAKAIVRAGSRKMTAVNVSADGHQQK